MHHDTHPPMLESVRLDVTDVERALDWHERVLGATRLGGGRSHVGATTFELVAGQPGNAPADHPGAFHVCVSVADVRGAASRLAELGVRMTTEPLELIPGVWAVYFLDPDGLRYQFVQSPGESRLHHFAYSVSDLDATLGWYRATFGIEPTYRAEASGERVARTLEVEDGAYCVALVPVGAAHLELMEWAPAREPRPAGWRLEVGGTHIPVA